MSWNGYCEKCEVNTRSYWCKACNAKRFQQNFKNWTSGNNDIDKFIQDTQLSATHWSEVLEWIPYNKFYDIEYIAKGGFGKVYRAKWIDGQIERWDNENQNWRRFDSNMFVALKSLNNSENVTLEFINEIKLHSKIGAYTMNVIIAYGITQDPETKNYMMVLEYAENGSLRNYLNKNYSELDWENKLKNLLNIASGLEKIHENELTHRDLHIGNVLMNHSQTIITDMGLCKPADYKESESAKNKIYGVLPYISPEILRGQNYTKASDIYSFEILNQWYREFSNLIELQKQIKEAEEINHSLSTSSIPLTNLGLTYETHSEAVYTSRLLNFNNLPEPKNSDDYYDERNDNIISENFSESLQINISQLKISDAEETKNVEEMIE
ncbi:kinase-like domain-containing protein [Rhizophagus irregularis DAOM 181602=DAOM 197198]|nr:kinase-like domain-containing protein [Rhizophagus irregularis DAOM 181602=DAOM 197198]